jgi:hypothetical protein
MTALTANRNTPQLGGDAPVDEFTILASEIIYAGGIVAIDYTAEAQEASDTLGLRVVGRATKQVDNAADGLKVSVERGIFRFGNSSTSPVTRAHIGRPCYVEDDATVAGNTTNLVAAGLVHDVDTSGVWVDMTLSAMATAIRETPPVIIPKTDDYTVTAAQAFSRRCIFTMSKSSLSTLTLPSAVPTMKVAVQRLTASSGYDVALKANSGDTVMGSAAGKKLDNEVDGVSGILWVEAMDATAWINAWPTYDLSSWVINNA